MAVNEGCTAHRTKVDPSLLPPAWNPILSFPPLSHTSFHSVSGPFFFLFLNLTTGFCAPAPRYLSQFCALVAEVGLSSRLRNTCDLSANINSLYGLACFVWQPVGLEFFGKLSA